MLSGRRLAPGAALSFHRPAAASARPAGITSSLPEHLLWACTLFNLALCLVDTKLFVLSPLPVMAAEAAILVAAVLVPFSLHSRSPGRMDLLLLLLAGSWLLLSLLRQDLDPKLFRDVAIMPIFVLLGMASRSATLHQRLFWLHMVVFAFAVWEAVSPGTFVSVFSIADYFAHTRNLASDEWWVDSGLYLSAVRPEARFLFPNLPVHRLSSVFLEPVSLGNYVMISTIWLAGFWRQIPRHMRVVAAVVSVLLLIGSDSRMASLTCVAVVLAAPFRRWIPSFLPVLTAPAVIAAMFVAVWSLGLETGLDNFGGRLAHSVGVFQDFRVRDYLGLSLAHMKAAEDAGFAYVIISQSLIVALIIWGSLFVRRLKTPDSRYVHLAVALYVALNLTVSWSLFSIKTAALLWFLLGRSIREDKEAAEAPTAGVRQAYSATGAGSAGKRVHLAGSLSRST